MKFRAAAFFAMLATASGAIAGEEAWNTGRMFVPASLTTEGKPCVSQIGGKCVPRLIAGRHPTVVFLHGCGGVRRIGAFADLGVIVVQPNSFWQGERCSLNIAETAKLLSARMSDAAEVAQQLKATPWADPERLVLAGFSQGGIAAALYDGPEFRARIVIALPCQPRSAGPSGPQAGVRGEGPVLAIQNRNDELYKRLGIEGDCGPEIAGRPGSRSVVIPGGANEIMNHPATRSAIAAFIPEVLGEQ